MGPKGLEIIGNDAYLNGYKLESLVKQYTTPLYVMDEKSIRSAIEDYQTYFKGNYFKSSIIYASKAFLVPKLVEIINEYHLYMDAVSIGDLYVALQSNFPPQHLVFHGNNKSFEELNFAIDNKIGLIVVDNYHELQQLIAICEAKKTTQNILYLSTRLHNLKYLASAFDTPSIGKKNILLLIPVEYCSKALL